MLSRRNLIIGSGSFFLTLNLSYANSKNSKFGHFTGDLNAKFDTTDNRSIVLLSDLVFIAPEGRKWLAPKGTKVNGASIPRPLWSIVGSPYVGEYRRASVIHDHHCVIKKHDWRDVHLTFYYACRADGLKEYFSLLLYASVMRFGPRWEKNRDTGRLIITQPKFNKKDFDEIKKWIHEKKPSIRDINKKFF